jgi:hypothetical protein
MITWYDYDNQAWVVRGEYVRCGHQEIIGCRCYGMMHEGEEPTPEIMAKYGKDTQCDTSTT